MPISKKQREEALIAEMLKLRQEITKISKKYQDLSKRARVLGIDMHAAAEKGKVAAIKKRIEKH